MDNIDYAEKISLIVGGNTIRDITNYITSNSNMYCYVKYKSIRVYNGKFVRNFNIEEVRTRGKAIKKLYELIYTIRLNVNECKKDKYNISTLIRDKISNL